MKFRQAYDFFKFIFLVRSNITGSRLLFFSFNRGGFLALNLNIHLNLTQCGSCLYLHIVCVC
jgi:hypothetical protein